MWRRLRTWGANGAIVALLALMFVQTCPGIPQWLSWRLDAVASLLGLWQAGWKMFAPPDAENHRLRAVLTYAGGRRVEWQSPDLQAQSTFARFTGHRRSEYVDAIRDPFHSPAWPGFARWLARTEGGTVEQTVARIERVEIHVDYVDIPDPRLHAWPAHDAPAERSTSLLYEEDFP
jgi:hypothetical protein